LSQQLVVINVKNIIKILPLEKLQILKEDIILSIKPTLLHDCLVILKNHILFQFKTLQCISGADYPYKKYRFKIIYELLSYNYNSRVRVKTFTHELLGIRSCNLIFDSSSWYECEIWDMFGIFFVLHDYLKRILTDYGFEGYPLRKDFPLSGFIEARFNNFQKRVANEVIELYQEYRIFDFLSTWQIQKF